MKIKGFVRNGRLLALIPFFSSSENIHDNVIVDKHNTIDDSSDLTGFQRLRNLFKPYQDHPIHPRLFDLFQLSAGSLMAGGIYGGINRSREAFIKFIEKNEATQFRSHLDAKRRLSDEMFMSFLRGFGRWGLKVSFFCTTFLTTYTVLSVYRNNDSIFYYTLSGLSAGSLYKVPLGPKGMISGGFFGAAFGSLFGGLKFIELLILNKTEEELRSQRIERNTEILGEQYKPEYNIAFKESKEELKELLKIY